MRVLTEVGEINNVVIRHKGTGYKYRRIVGSYGYRGYREAQGCKEKMVRRRKR